MSWPHVFASQPTGNVPAAYLDDNFNAAVQGAGSSATNSIAQFADTSGKVLATGSVGVGTAANNVLQLDGAGKVPIGTLNLSQLTSSLTTQVIMAASDTWYDGPAVTQGTAGVWYVSATVTVSCVTASTFFPIKLWDGTTVFASTVEWSAVGTCFSASVSGIISNPVGNLRVSVLSEGVANNVIEWNRSAVGKDTTITALRIG